MFAIRAERDYTIEEDYMKAARKIGDNKKLEGKLDYEKVLIIMVIIMSRYNNKYTIDVKTEQPHPVSPRPV